MNFFLILKRPIWWWHYYKLKYFCSFELFLKYLDLTLMYVYRSFFSFFQGYSIKVYVLSALNLAMFPVLYFFTFLYYTDCGSTFFVLLMYYLHLRHSFLRAAVAGAISLFFRQTNIVWVFYVSIWIFFEKYMSLWNIYSL